MAERDLAIEAHGGRLWVEANEPEGSAFCIRFPNARVLDPVEQTQQRGSIPQDARRAAG